MSFFTPQVLRPHDVITTFAASRVSDSCHQLTDEKFEELCGHPEFLNPRQMISVVMASTKHTVGVMFGKLMNHAHYRMCGTKMEMYKIADELLSKGYSREEYDEYQFLEIFKKYLTPARINSVMAANGIAHYITNGAGELSKIFKKLSARDAKRAFFAVPYSHIPLLMYVREDNSMPLTGSEAENLMRTDRVIIKTFYKKFKKPNTRYYQNSMWLWQAEGVDAMLCDYLLDNRNKDCIVNLLDKVHAWIRPSPVKEVVELYEAMDCDVPGYYRLLNGQVDMIEPNEVPNVVEMIKKHPSYRMSEGVLRSLFFDLDAKPDIDFVLKQGYMELALDLYDGDTEFDWSKYTEDLVDNLGNFPIIEHLLKTIPPQNLLKYGKNISKFTWITQKDMIDYFQSNDDGTVCPICLDDITGAKASISTACGHKFHYDCFSRVANKHSCPMCRQNPL